MQDQKIASNHLRGNSCSFVTANDAADQALMRHFGSFGPPTCLFFGPAGSERWDYRVIGFMPTDDFKKHLQRALHP